MTASTYKYSAGTAIKQEHLETAIRLHASIAGAVMRKMRKQHLYAGRPYLYFDLNAGPGIDPHGDPGSPLIIIKILREYGIPYRAFLYEKDIDTADILFSRDSLSKDLHVSILTEDHNNLISSPPCSPGRWQFGIVYSDPSNAEIPVEVLRSITKRWPRLDIIINLACASFKRRKNLVGYQEIPDELGALKKYWMAQEPYGKHQWSIMIGTNYMKYPQWRGWIDLMKRRELYKTKNDIQRESDDLQYSLF